jgi:hypothetical protein
MSSDATDQASTERREVVYVMTDREFVKIGRAANVWRRARTLQTGNPRKIFPLFGADVGYMSNRLESDLHRHFADYRECGEWFRISTRQALDALVVRTLSHACGRIVVFNPSWHKEVRESLAWEASHRATAAGE